MGTSAAFGKRLSLAPLALTAALCAPSFASAQPQQAVDCEVIEFQ